MPQVLQGQNVVFSGVVPTHISLNKSRAYKVAKCLGANVSESINVDSPDTSSRTVQFFDSYPLLRGTNSEDDYENELHILDASNRRETWHCQS